MTGGPDDETSEDESFETTWSHPVTRRRLLRSAGLGAGVLAGASWAAGQPAGASAPGARIGRVVGAAAERLASGTMMTSFDGGLAHPFLELDPVVQTAFGTVVVTDYVHGVLYRLDPFPPRAEVTPELAVDLPEQIDPTTYRIALRDDVTFHDGGEFTAADVVFTIERIKDPSNNSLFMRFFEIVDHVEAIDSHLLEARLASPTTLLAPLLALVKIQSQAAVESSPAALELEPVGTGPYAVAAAVSGQEVTLRRFADYRGARQFHYDELTFAVASDANARITGLRSGQWKAIDELPTSAFVSVGSTAGLAADGVPAYHQVDLLFNCGRPPFDDPRVRRAVLYAIDRDAITAASFFGLAEPAWAGHLAPSHPSFVRAPRVYRYDPDEARSLLADADLADAPIEIELLFANDVEVINSQASIVEQNLRDVGFVPNLTPGAQESLYSRVTEGTFDAYIASRDPSALGVTDAVLLLRLMFTGDVPRQLFHWGGAALERSEELSNAAVAAANEDERDEIIAEIIAHLQEDVPLAPLHFKRQLTGWSEALDGFRPLPTVGLALEGVSG